MITAGKYFLLVQLKNIWEQLRKYFGWIVWSVNNFGETCFSFCQLQLVQSLTWFLLTTNCQLWKIFILISIITRQCKTMQDNARQCKTVSDGLIRNTGSQLLVVWGDNISCDSVIVSHIGQYSEILTTFSMNTKLDFFKIFRCAYKTPLILIPKIR